MAAIEQALPRWLLESAPVSALISNRMFPHTLLQPSSTYAELPAVTYQFISSVDQMLLGSRSGLVFTRLQLVAYGNTAQSALAVARAMKNNGVTELKGTVHGVDIRGVSVVDGIHTDEEYIGDGEQAVGSQRTRHLAEFDLMVSYRE